MLKSSDHICQQNVNKKPDGFTEKTHLQEELHQMPLFGNFLKLLQNHHYLPIILHSCQSLKKETAFRNAEIKSNNFKPFIGKSL